MITITGLVRSIGPQGPQLEAMIRNDDTGSLRLLDISTRPHQTIEGLISSVASLLQVFPDDIKTSNAVKRKMAI